MPRMITAVCLLALVLAACGGADSGDTATSSPGATTPQETTNNGATDTTEPTKDEEPEDQGSQSGSSSGLPPGGTGTVTIGGETIESTWVGNCMIDEQFDPQPGDLDLTASLGGIEALFLEISNMSLALGGDPVEFLQVRASMQLRSDSGEMALYDDVVYVQAPDGSWYEDADGAAGFTIARGETPEGDPVTPAPLVLDGDRATGTVMLDDGSGPVEVAYDLTVAEPVDCSL